jgi:hypothetical protein
MLVVLLVDVNISCGATRMLGPNRQKNEQREGWNAYCLWNRWSCELISECLIVCVRSMASERERDQCIAVC